MKFSSLCHRTVYLNQSIISKSLPLIPSLLKYDQKGAFHLVDDPLKTRKTCIIGMFVLRPANRGCTTKNTNGLYGDHDWAYNIKGLDGGRLISNNSAVDAYRLAFQYAMSDAVIIGSNIVSKEGIDTSQHRGYLWQPYEVCRWDHLRNADHGLEEKLTQQRTLWQSMNSLSKRKYPAQIVFSWSGEKYENAYDFLGGRVFHDFLPGGERVEAYIMTSEAGAANIRLRAAAFGLADRIENMLIVVPPPPTNNLQAVKEEGVPESERSAHHLSAALDLSAVPGLLFEKYDIRIANHDGGQGVLRAFARAGVLNQLNLTLCKQKSVLEVLEHCGIYDQDTIDATHFRDPAMFQARVQYFFHNTNTVSTKEDTTTTVTDKVPHSADDSILSTTGDFIHALPRNVEIASIIECDAGEVAIVTLKTNFRFDFSNIN